MCTFVPLVSTCSGSGRGVTTWTSSCSCSWLTTRSWRSRAGGSLCPRAALVLRCFGVLDARDALAADWCRQGLSDFATQLLLWHSSLHLFSVSAEGSLTGNKDAMGSSVCVLRCLWVLPWHSPQARLFLCYVVVRRDASRRLAFVKRITHTLLRARCNELCLRSSFCRLYDGRF